MKPRLEPEIFAKGVHAPEEVKPMKPALTLLMMMIFASSPMVGYSQEQPPPVPSEEVPAVMTRGPVNEAFAQPVNIENTAGLIAPAAPPADIDEIPPDEKPVGDQYTWVPGYWAWDTDSKDYIWVSGCWRAVPPNMAWVPGYWTQVPGGWQWVAGYWGPVKAQAVEYLPEPPAVTDVDPPAAPASANQIWVPPCWYWHRTRYIQRPGYWIAGRPDWVWVPSGYIWTPRGYIFVPGHWDYTLAHRGVLFAPVYFPPRMVARPGFSYSLSIVVDLGNLQFGLFTRPRYHHYYFGDYYDTVYLRMGIFPRFECERRRGWYDPIYVHDRWRHHRDKPKWEQYERREYERRRDHRDLRPPRTYADMQHRMKRMSPAKQSQFGFAAPVTRFAARKATPMRFERIRPAAHRQLSRHTADVRKFVDERSRRESAGQGRKAGQPMPERKSPSAFKAAPSPMKHQKPMARSPQPPVDRQERHYNKGMAPPDKRQEAAKNPNPPSRRPKSANTTEDPTPKAWHRRITAMKP